MESAYFKLLLGDNEGTKSAMDECEKVLDGLDSVDLTVHASFYRVSGDYYKVRLLPSLLLLSLSLSRELELTRTSRQKPNTPITTRTLCCTSLALMLRRTFRTWKECRGLMIWVCRRCWERFTTLGNWYVGSSLFLLRASLSRARFLVGRHGRIE